MNKEIKILISIAAVVIVAGAILFFKGNPQPQKPGKPVDSQSLIRDTSHMTGKKGAKVTVVEFGDYQCPACGYAYPITKQVLAQYQNNPDFNFIFRNFPLTTIHPNALVGAEAAEAAGDQGKFWEMHDLLYEKQTEWAEQQDPMPFFLQYAQQLGLDANKFKSTIQSNKFADVINADVSDGNALGVNGTPTFYINGERQDITPSVDQFKQKIDGLLK